MNRIKSFLQSIILLLVLCLPLKGMAQGVEMLSDSLVYNLTMYKTRYNDYKDNKDKKQKELITFIGNQFKFESGVININTKFETLGLDSVDVIALAKTFSNKNGVSISDDDIIGLSMVSDLSDIVCKEDSTELIFVYYPWKAVFDTHSVHRVGLYSDGINILKDLIKYTCDSIQREIYINELMHVYDVWYEYADTINASMNETFSKTMIKSDKVRDYIAMYPDEITSENVMQPHFVKMYDFVMDALNEPENQEEVHYMNIDKLMVISVKRLSRNWKKYQEQYVADFDLFDVRMQLLLEYVAHADHVKNIDILHAGHTKIFEENIAKMDEVVAGGDCGKLEETFATQMLENAKDEKFLNRVIRKMRGCPNSEVLLEALENYTDLFPTVTTENVDDVMAKRRLLANVYLKRERYDEAVEQIRFMLSVEKDNVEKANLYYLWGNILERQGNNQQAAFRYKSAVKLNANHGNAYFRLALMYSKNKFKLGNDEKSLFIDKYKYLLCIDKLEIAKKKIQEYANSGDYGKYNDTELSLIDQLIASFKTNCPDQANAHMFGLDKEYWTSGGSFTFKGGVMNGETTTIRFYY